MNTLLKRIRLNYKYITKLSVRWTTALFSILGFIGTFTSLSDLFDDSLAFYIRFMISVGILFGTFVLSFLFCAIYISGKRRIEIAELNGGHHIYVQYGDVFSQDEVLNPRERRNVVIPVNRCFDTKVDDDLISSKSLHGIAMKKLYEEGIFTAASLNQAIQNNLKKQNVQPEATLSVAEKRSGNLKRYPVGAVAEIEANHNCTYFFLGLSKFDRDLKASTSIEEYVVALIRLLVYCNARSQQFPIVIPLIGGGLSRVDASELAILEYMVRLIKMNESLVHGDVHIVVRDSGKECIGITNL